MYTLVGAGVLALDLARHPRGAAVADVVDRALALAGRLPATGTDPRPGRSLGRARLRDVAGSARASSEALPGVTLLPAAEPLPGLTLLPAAEPRLEPVAGAPGALPAAPLDRLAGLVELLRTELSGRDGLDPEAVELVVDRAVAAWTGSDDGQPDLRVPVEGWDEAVARLPRPAPAPTGTGALLDLLEAVARCDRRSWLALDAVHRAQRRGSSWSELVDEATRVAAAADRTLEVARWQMSAVRAAVVAGHARSPAAPGAMTSIVGAVQGLCVQDLLPHAAVQDLVAPCRAVLLT